MRTDLRDGYTVPDFDALVREAIERATQRASAAAGGTTRIGVRNAAGAIYRVIETAGMPEFQALVGEMARRGCVLEELAVGDTTRQSFDAIFSRSTQR